MPQMGPRPGIPEDVEEQLELAGYHALEAMRRAEELGLIISNPIVEVALDELRDDLQCQLQPNKEDDSVFKQVRDAIAPDQSSSLKDEDWYNDYNNPASHWHY